MGKPKIFYYHDGRHPHIYRYEPPMHREEYLAMVDELAGTTVEVIAFCLGEGRTMLHDTRAGELMGHNVETWDHLIFRRAWQNAQYLIEAGDDPLRIVCDRAHELGMQVYPTLIVQRGGVEHASVRCSNFRIENQHLEIGATGDVAADYLGFDGLDFKHPQVREERFSIVAEVMGEYPVDGFELQLNQMPYFFHPNEIEAGRSLMSAWVGRVHEAVHTAGGELVIHLPDQIEDCLAAGLDPEEWVKRGIVDALVPERCGENYRLKIDADYGVFTALTAGTDCRILGTVNSMVASDRLQDATVAMIRATACNAWDQGVDGLYVSEWFRLWPYGAEVYEKLRELPFPCIMDARDKNYFAPTDTSSPALNSECDPLPRDLKLDETVTVPLRISDDVPKWDAVGRVHEVLLRLRVLSHVETDVIRIELNGAELPLAQARKINQLYTMEAPRYRVMGGYWYIFRLVAGQWPVKGQNEVSVTLLARDADIEQPHCVWRDVELEVQYLKGKHFHRSFSDPDLGTYDYRS